MFKKFKTVFKVIEWIAFIVLLCLLFVVISPKLPLKNVPKSFVVVSGSMEPTIKTGSVAFTKTIDPKNIKSSDIIAFTSPSDSQDTILHRVNSISSTDPLLFKTKGDNNNDIDAWDVPDVGVKGVYFFAIPYLGSLAAVLRQPWGFAVIVGIPAFIFIISQILNIKKAIDDEVNRKVAQKLEATGTRIEIKPKSPTNLKSLIFFFLFSAAILGINHISQAKALYSDSVVVSGITISTADFTKPSPPQLIDPENNSFVNTSGLVMKWYPSDTHARNQPIYYIYQSSLRSDFNPPAYTSGPLWSTQIPAPGTPNGIYYWHVKACFSADTCSDWSEIWKVTVDSTIPVSTITSPYNSGNHQINVSLNSWDGKIEGTASDNLSGINRVEISIQKDSNQFWDGSDWITGTESTVRVGTTGTTNWNYQISDTVSSGTYKIISHAIDNAGNIENSATILFKYVQLSTPPVSKDFDISLSSDHSNHKINISLDNISKPSDYEILYIGNGVEKGLIGKITADEITDSKYSQDFYLGICSAGGTCVSDDVLPGSNITVNISGSQTLTKTFTY